MRHPSYTVSAATSGRTPSNIAELEDLIGAVLGGHGATTAVSKWQACVEVVRRFRPRKLRAVVLGGGTGMSTIVGGNAAGGIGAETYPLGLKTEFGRLDVVACTTDDGGSTGELLKHLPVIGIGDLRKSCAAMILPERLQKLYGVSYHEAGAVAKALQRMFNYRFGPEDNAIRFLRDPVLAWPAEARKKAPRRLRAALKRWGGAFGRISRERRVPLAGHCLGNLLLIGALRCVGWKRHDTVPSAAQLQSALDMVAETVGATAGCLHAATHVPGQLCFRYANGVEVIGQSKAGRARRGFPIAFVYGLYAGKPRVAPGVRRLLSTADVIIYAPGSLYSSMIPVLQLPEITNAIRANRKALKILAANFWIQEGETDISPQQFGRGFFVSDILKAYEQNIPGGTRNLFDVVLCSNLEHLPGNVLRSYALEGKHPIHLDRRTVERMGYQPVEAVLFGASESKKPGVIHHDASKFAMAVRTLVVARNKWGITLPVHHGRPGGAQGSDRARPRTTGVLPSRHVEIMGRIVGALKCSHESVRDTLNGLLWEHRDIQPAHFAPLKGVKVVGSKHWGRSVEWDNVLGYYERSDRNIYLHDSLLKNESRLKRDLLIALGETLLGDYIAERRWTDLGGAGRCFSIRLRPASRRICCLSDGELRTYLELARMTNDPTDADVYRIVVNDNEGFLPPGLLFGLMYAWYLDNASGGVMEYEMSLLRWPESSLIPYQAAERRRKEALVEFFRRIVFRHEE